MVPRRAARVILLVTTSLAVTACSTSEGEPSTSPTSTAGATPDAAPTPTPTATPTQSSTPTPTSAPEPAAPEPTATSTFDATDRAEVVAVTARRTIVADGTAVTAHDRQGRIAWRLRRPGDETSSVTGTTQTADVVVASWDKREPASRFYPPVAVRVLDVTTGAELWRDGTASYARAIGGVVLTAECTGDQDRHLGDCTLSSRDPRTGSTRWSVPTYASTRVADVDGGVLLTQSYPANGGTLSWQARDVATGAALGPEIEGPGTAAVAGLLDTPFERPSSDGCFSTVRAVAVDGDTRWTRRLRVGTDPSDRRECRHLDVHDGGDGPRVLATYDGPTWVLDPRTGRVLRRFEAGRTVATVVGGVAVVLDAPTGYGGAASGVRVRDGRDLWGPADGDGDVTWAAVGRHLLRTTDASPGCTTDDVDPRTGDVVASYAGGLAASGPGWIATRDRCASESGDVRIYRLEGAS